jgi:putative nucleotidyltransferase with HDIG domain
MNDIRNEIKNINEIVPIPPTITLILSQSLSGEMANEKLIRLIEADAVLTAMILRAANSAFYGLRSGVATISHAVMLLGHAEISRLVLMYDMKQRVFSLNKDQRDYLNRLWLHSISTATTSRIIAKQIGFPTIGEEFTAGLLHDMGKIVLAQHFSHSLIKTQNMIEELGMSDVEAEMQVLAIAHDEVGGILAENWSLPQVIINVMRHHHNVEQAGEHTKITAVVRLADLLSEHWGLGIGEKSEEIVITEDPCWSVLTDGFASLTGEPFDAFEEGVRMEFENNQAFSELFS